MLAVGPQKEDVPETQPSFLHKITARLLDLIPGLRGTRVSERLMVAVHGSMWTFAGYGCSQLLKLASTLILARLLLDPRAFGLMALVNVFLGGLEVLSDLGIGLDVVQHPRGEEPAFLDTAFLMQMVRSTLLCGIAIGLAVPFASFYHQPEVRWLAIVGSFSIGVRGFASMSIWQMTRRVQLGKLNVVNVSADATGLIVSVIWALTSPTAWALVAGRVATAATYVVVSHLFADRRPSLTWERSIAREILTYGTGMFLSSTTYFLATESERLVVGKFATVAELGCFSLALSMSYAPFGIVRRVISNVYFPMISSVARENNDRVARQFRKFRVVFLAASLLMAIGFITLSEPVVRIVLRPQYAATAWMLQLLGFRAALDLFATAAGATLMAVGISRYAAVGNVVKVLYLAAGLGIAFSHYGLRQAMWVLALGPAVYYVVALWGLRKTVRQVLWSEIGYFAVFSGVSGVTALTYHLLTAR